MLSNVVSLAVADPETHCAWGNGLVAYTSIMIWVRQPSQLVLVLKVGDSGSFACIYW